jgi:hypothetical protein
MTDEIVVITTCAAAVDAERMAGALVDGRLAACVNLAPGVRSVSTTGRVPDEYAPGSAARHAYCPPRARERRRRDSGIHMMVEESEPRPGYPPDVPMGCKIVIIR